MIYEKKKLKRRLKEAYGTSIREHMGGVEVLHSSGVWKSVSSHYSAPFFAKLFVDLNIQEPGNYFLYGIGAGYLIPALIESEVDGHVYVLETNMDIINFAEKNLKILATLENTSRVTFCGSDEIREVQQFLSSLPEGHRIRYFNPSLDAVPEKLSVVKDWCNNRMIDMNSSARFAPLVEHNLAVNLHKGLPDVLRALQGKLSGPCVIVVSGPSAPSSMIWLKSVQEKVTIISIGRNGKLFKDAGFSPDLWVDMDPQHNHEIWKRFEANDTSVPLAILDSASTMVYDYFKGAIGIVRSQVDGTEKYALKPGKSTVAALALELAVCFGCGPIAIVGQDLCYVNNQSHAGESAITTFGDTTPKVLCNDGEKRYSSKEFIRHIESVEAVLQRYHTEVYTLSYEGVKLDGALYCTQEQFSDKLNDKYNKNEMKKRIREAFLCHE